jgi:hypothetical protein
MAAAFVLPCVSPTFYRQAARRRLVGAIGFFALFVLIISGLESLNLLRGMTVAGADIRRAFSSGKFPEISISRGVADVRAPQPLVLVDEAQTLIALDTTGEYTRIDRSRYEQGMILTRETLIVMTSDGRYQEIPLGDLNQVADPIVINGSTVTAAWAAMTAAVTVSAFFVLLFWHGVLRLMALLVVALVLWGVATLVRPGTGFGPALATGLYAVVPSAYVAFLLGQVGVAFPGLQTLALSLIWVAGLIVALWPTVPDETASLPARLVGGERSLRPWRALLGLPFLLVVALSVIFSWRLWGLTWGLGVATWLVLAGVGLAMAQRRGSLPQGSGAPGAAEGPGRSASA